MASIAITSHFFGGAIGGDAVQDILLLRFDGLGVWGMDHIHLEYKRRNKIGKGTLPLIGLLSGRTKAKIQIHRQQLGYNGRETVLIYK